ncbi:hypothetical protein AAE02nite_08410 [Adhaeribacter aerolatus]|uniref:DUF898 domain-containing protein n=1 Tax=Adhaeribacter aerolatus TaxID=670289 RepID=A0A512AUC2_9BACT|nr:DUF898 family protein [Adhaeribacter aerolatus]GEO03177.1 hypothetical protein AAE02nite_08410 [Adhaeribacter aerolatus]
MEENSTTTQSYPFVFHGKGTAYFEIQLANWVLTFISLGFYYPWAKANSLRYLYSKTEFAGSRFTFHGTGKEMFLGFIKAIGIFILLYGAVMAGALSGSQTWLYVGLGVFYVGFMALIPLAIHGRMRYRMSRTSWRGIHFGYRGQLMRLYGLFISNLLLTIITFGIYGSWYTVNLRKEIIGNIRMGNVRFSYEGTGTELFIINLKGLVLTILTLGGYLFAYTRDLHNYYLNNVYLEQNGHYSRLSSSVTGWGYFKLVAINLFIVVFSLGIAAPFATIRTMRFVLQNAELVGEFDADNLLQTEDIYKDATYEDVSDMLDISLV